MSSSPAPSDRHAHVAAHRRPECVERWPECASGAYDPRCCRFPKSCSCNVPDESAATVSDFCECGHQRHLHVSFEREGACTGKRDTRPVTVGGPELTPCDCKQFRPLGWANVRV